MPGLWAGEGGGSGSSAGAALTGPSPREGRRRQLGPARAETHREHRLGHRLPPPRPPPPPLQLHPGNSGDAALGQRRLFPALSDALRPLCPLCSRATLPSVNIGCVRLARRPSVPPFGKHRLPPPSTTPFSPSLRQTSAPSVTLGPPCPSRLGPLSQRYLSSENIAFFRRDVSARPSGRRRVRKRSGISVTPHGPAQPLAGARGRLAEGSAASVAEPLPRWGGGIAILPGRRLLLKGDFRE
ncbi:uncharacterized protein LOC117003180 [Catharus ustulatus]|uniref:uncharacterized protein LOC117003180 n=1 Tax=Catharus ustulatus TaxID=91951 RepID=UPI001C5A5C4F|nr:uncharacterized protein LOC117003180 [Catharus ustulatus]